MGNVTAVKTYAYTTGTLGTPTATENYTYNSQNQRTDLTYDTTGNLTELNGYTFGWTGRRLTSAVSEDANISYTYNHNGIRTSKTIGETTIIYTIDENNNVIEQTDGTNTMKFIYDSNNAPLYMEYNETLYYYEKNLQGDIVGILDTNGNAVVQYSYDIWGKLLSITGTLADILGASNPLCYRGYYYDIETELYYLQSRYYSPEIMRFISQDDVVLSNAQGEPLGSNLYVYCFNNPIFFRDSSEMALETILDIGGTVWSLVDLAQNPSWGNFAFLGWDLVSILAPYVLSSYVGKGGSKVYIKIASKIDDFSGGTKIVTDTYKKLKKAIKGMKKIS